MKRRVIIVRITSDNNRCLGVRVFDLAERDKYASAANISRHDDGCKDHVNNIIRGNLKKVGIVGHYDLDLDILEVEDLPK